MNAPSPAGPFALSAEALEWKEKIRPLARALMEHEVAAELGGGELPTNVAQRHRREAIALGLSRMDVPVEFGGLALPWLVQAAVWEELGQVTTACPGAFPNRSGGCFEPAQLTRSRPGFCR